MYTVFEKKLPGEIKKQQAQGQIMKHSVYCTD